MKLISKLKSGIAITAAVTLLIQQPVFAISFSGADTNREKNLSGNITVQRNIGVKGQDYADNQLIIKFNGRAQDQNKLLAKYNLTVLKRSNKAGCVLVSVRPNQDMYKILKLIKNEKNIQYVQPNFYYKIFGNPNDPQYSRQWALKSINAVPNLGNNKTGSKKPIIIAVLDTGVDVNHPDLKNRIIPGTNATNPLKSTRDSEGHGTHVAGIAAATTNNGLGISGVAGIPEVKIMPVKVFEGDNGSDISISDGIIWAADHGARVINMSFGSFYKSTVLNDAIEYAYKKGVVLVAAAGNWASEEISYPAALSKVIAVSALNKERKLAEFSSYGPMIDVCAPGDEIYSTYWDQYKGSTYTEMSGTSMASPMVAGLAAMILAKRSQLTNEEVRQIIEASAIDLGTPGWDPQFGHGEINMAKALNLTLSKIDDKNSSMDKAVALQDGEAKSDKIDFGSDEDWYKIFLPEKGHLQIEVQPAGKVSPGVEIYNPLGKLITSFNTGSSNALTDDQMTVGGLQSSLKVSEAVYGLVPDLISGNYYIKVFGNHYRWTEEKYTINAKIISENNLVEDKYEPNESYEDAHEISAGTSIEGAILSPKDEDWYKVRLTGKTYKIHVDVPAGLDLAVEVEGEANFAEQESLNNDTKNYNNWFYQEINNGGIGEDEDGVIVLPENSRGNYYINVYETSGACVNSNYKIKIVGFNLTRDQYESNDKPDNAALIKLGQEITANFHAEEDQDWYCLNVEQEGILKINLQQPDNVWCNLSLYNDPEKAPLGQNYIESVYGQMPSTDDYSDYSDQNKEQVFEFKVFPGKYYINVNNYDGSLGDNYKFTAKFTPYNFIDQEPNDFPSKAITLTPGKTKSGTIYPTKDIDFFMLDVEKPQPYLVYMTSPSDLDTQILVMREADKKINSNDDKEDAGDSTNYSGKTLNGNDEITEPMLEMVTMINTEGKGKPDSGVFIPSKPGEYYLLVFASGKSVKPYNINVRPFTPSPDKWEDNSTLGKAKPVACGSSINPSFMGIEDQDWYKTYVNKNGTLNIELFVPDDIDGVLEIYNQQGRIIAKADQAMVGEKEYYSLKAKPGYYYIKTYDYLGNSSVQSYNLKISLK